MFHCGLYSNLFFQFFYPSPILSISVWFYRPSLLSESILCFLSQPEKEGKDFKAQPFSKNACFLRFQYSLNGLIVYGENIYKEYNKKNINFVAAWIWKTKLKRKYPKKCQWKGCRHPRNENLLFSCDCAMFFNIGYFIWK